MIAPEYLISIVEMQIVILQVKHLSIYEWIESAAWIRQSEAITDDAAEIPNSKLKTLDRCLQHENLSIECKSTVLYLVNEFTIWEI